MSFIVEDGTGLDDATSGASVGDADVYFRDRGVAEWIGTSAVKQGALIRATDYIELRWSSKFRGDKEFAGQALSFPRLDGGVSTGVPVAYMRAVFEYALRALSGPLAPDNTVRDNGLQLISESHKTGPIDDTYRYASKGANSVPSSFRSYPSADGQLKSLLVQSAGLIR